MTRTFYWPHGGAVSSTKDEQHLVLSVPLAPAPPAGGPAPPLHASVQAALDAYLAGGPIEDDVFQRNDRHQFVALPEVLTISLKRFTYDRVAKAPTKITQAVTATETLTIPPVALAPAVHETLGGHAARYRLVHAVHHEGTSVRRGHYTSLGRLPDGTWYEHDDTAHRGNRRTPLPDATAQTLLDQAYIYVYQRQH
jgi:hypothetical protein